MNKENQTHIDLEALKRRDKAAFAQVLDQNSEKIYRLALAIWQEHWPPGQRMRLLGVGVSSLNQPAARQIDLGL